MEASVAAVDWALDVTKVRVQHGCSIVLSQLSQRMPFSSKSRMSHDCEVGVGKLPREHAVVCKELEYVEVVVWNALEVRAEGMDIFIELLGESSCVRWDMRFLPLNRL